MGRSVPPGTTPRRGCLPWTSMTTAASSATTNSTRPTVKSWRRHGLPSKKVQSDKFKNRKEEFLDRQIMKEDLWEIIIGKLPVMVKSDLCWIKEAEKDCGLVKKFAVTGLVNCWTEEWNNSLMILPLI